MYNYVFMYVCNVCTCMPCMYISMYNMHVCVYMYVPNRTQLFIIMSNK